MSEDKTTDADLVRRLCRTKKRRWIAAPWKLARLPGETDDAYKARSDAHAATHGYSAWGTLIRFSHAPWSCERAEQATRGWVGVRRA